MAANVRLDYIGVVTAAPGTNQRLVGRAELERLAGAAWRMLRDEPNVVALYLYGSAARGAPAHDLDLGLVTRGAPVSHRTLEKWAAELQQQALPHGPEIDLRILNGAAPRFRMNVVR